MPDPFVLNILAGITRQPVVGRSGAPQAGQGSGIGRIVEVVSRGQGVAVQVRNPLGRKAARVAPWNASLAQASAEWDPTRSDARTLTFTTNATQGTTLHFLVE